MNDALVIIIVLILPNALVFGLVYTLQTLMLKRGMKVLLCVVLAVLASLAFILAYLTILDLFVGTEKSLWLGLDATALASTSFAAMIIWIVVAPFASIFSHLKFKGLA